MVYLRTNNISFVRNHLRFSTILLGTTVDTIIHIRTYNIYIFINNFCFKFNNYNYYDAKSLSISSNFSKYQTFLTYNKHYPGVCASFKLLYSNHNRYFEVLILT